MSFIKRCIIRKIKKKRDWHFFCFGKVAVRVARFVVYRIQTHAFRQPISTWFTTRCRLLTTVFTDSAVRWLAKKWEKRRYLRLLPFLTRPDPPVPCSVLRFWALSKWTRRAAAVAAARDLKRIWLKRPSPKLRSAYIVMT